MRRRATAAAIAAPAMLWGLRHTTSPAVRAWTPPTLPRRRSGRLVARMAGEGERAVVLLHGLVSTGDVFGGAYDELAATHRLVVPDLLGFGRSLDEAAASFRVADHLDALDELAAAAGILDRRWTIGAHSMGSTLALHWAARHADNVDRVVCWGAPVHPSPDAAVADISGSVMARVFALDTRWAERVCAINCRHRTVAGVVAATFAPTLPVPVARAASLHTWPAYRDAMADLVVDVDWDGLLGALAAAGGETRVEFVWGSGDRVGDHEYGSELAAAHRHVSTAIVGGADHHLPIADPQRCIDRLLG